MKELLVDPNTNDTIMPSNTWLYFRKSKKNVHHYEPYSLNQVEMLKTIKLALMGCKISKVSSTFKNSFIRFGWLDKGLKDLHWISLEDALKQLNSRTIKKSTRIKLDHVCRLLFISIKDIKHD